MKISIFTLSSVLIFVNILLIKSLMIFDMKKNYLLLLILLVANAIFAQVGINTTTPNAQLEIKSSSEIAPAPTDGLLIPKVNVFPATNPTIAQQGMLVYLTTTVGTNQPGFYFWDNATTNWKPITGATSAGTLDQAYDFDGAGLGKTITADAGAVLINGTDGLVSTGTFGSGAVAPSGGGTKMVWNPRKGAFRAGTVSNNWDDQFIGANSFAVGWFTEATGDYSTAFGAGCIATGDYSTAFGSSANANGDHSTAFGISTSAYGFSSTSFGNQNTAKSFGETVLGIGATDYTPSANGANQYRVGNATDRLFVIGNALDANNNSYTDIAERSDAIIILKNGLTRLPSTTNAMITAADGKAVVTKEYLQSAASGTLDQAYDFGGAGLGKTITADAGAVLIDGTDGLVSTGTPGVGAIAPSGTGTKMFWNPRKSAFRAGRVNGIRWDDISIGLQSTAFGFSTLASGNTSTAFGGTTTASGASSTAFGSISNASGTISTAFGSETNASGTISTAFGKSNSASSYGETVLGIGATTYTTSVNGASEFLTANATDRLFVIGNAIDSNNNSLIDIAERSDAMIVLKNGLTRLPSTTNAMITAADGKTVVTKEYLQSNTSGTLDQAYDFGGAGLGKTITADAGAVLIDGTDGFVSTGTPGVGAIAPSGAGTKMFWNPRKAAFRAGSVSGNSWDDVNIGQGSIAFGVSTTASGTYSTTFGFGTIASGLFSTAFGANSTASGTSSTAFGANTTASGVTSTAFGTDTIASGSRSTAFGESNTAPSYGETVLGIGATTYTPSTNGATLFRTANETDRLFVIGNAIDADNDNVVDTAERSDAMIVLKNGLTRLPSTTNAMITAADGKAVVTKEYLQNNTSGTLDQAYDFGGAGNGKTITADSGAVLIDGTDGLVSTGILGGGAIAPSGSGTRMVWNPRKGAFRAATSTFSSLDDVNIGPYSIAFGLSTIASGSNSAAFGNSANASNFCSTAFGSLTRAIGSYSTAFGRLSDASGSLSIASGLYNTAPSFGETVLGIGATDYTPSTNGDTQFRTANATDRLFVVGNAIDLNNNTNVDIAERSDALIVLKNGLTRLPSTTNAMITAADGKAVVTKEYLEQNGSWSVTGNAGTTISNFIGTTDLQPFSIRTNNATRVRILDTGELGIGTTNPQEKLHVSGPAGLTAVRIGNTSNVGASSNVALDFFRNSNINTDWRIYNIGTNLTIGNSGDDLATVNDLYQFQGSRFIPMNDATQSLGQLGFRWNTVFASNGTINTSDIRQKKNIQNLNYGLTDLMRLRPVSFEWKKDDGSGTKIGLIAQELQQVIPEVVRDWDWEEDEQGNRKKVEASIMGVFYSDLIPVLIKSIQEQQVIIEQQKEENNSLKQQLETQSKTIDTILNRLQTLENK